MIILQKIWTHYACWYLHSRDGSCVTDLDTSCINSISVLISWLQGEVIIRGAISDRSCWRSPYQFCCSSTYTDRISWRIRTEIFNKEIARYIKILREEIRCNFYRGKSCGASLWILDLPSIRISKGEISEEYTCRTSTK